MSKRTRRSGFSLVELLVVIAVVAIAVALTIPAVQRAREAARHAQCRNNLRQIGLALHNYHESFGRLPSGFIGVDSQGNPEVSGPTGWGWAAMILPQLDENELFSRVNFNKSILDETNAEFVRTQLPEFRCPSDPSPAEFTLMAADGQTPLANLPTANYVGNFGTGDLDFCQNLVGLGMPCTSGPSMKSRGLFFHNSSVSLDAVIDGTSNTMLVSERSSATSLQRTATWLGVVPGSEDAYSLNLGAVSNVPSQSISNDDGFSSAHPGVVDVLMADGHVDAYSTETSPEVLAAIASRNAGDTPNTTVNKGQGGWTSSGTLSILVDAGTDLSRLPANVSLTMQRQRNGGGEQRIVAASATDKKGYEEGGYRAAPINAPGYPEWDPHFIFSFDDGTHGAWHAATPATPGPIIIKYDFRTFEGFDNHIDAAQKGLVAAAAQLWSNATCGKIVFLEDSAASNDEIIIIGVGSMLVFDFFDGPSGVLGVGGSDISSTNDHEMVSGFTWMDEEEFWDTEIGNGNPPGTIDFFTVLAHEFGHAIGVGHMADLPGDNMMNPFYDGEESQLTVNDISVLELIYGTDCPGGPGLGGLPTGWQRSDTTPPPADF